MGYGSKAQSGRIGEVTRAFLRVHHDCGDQRIVAVYLYGSVLGPRHRPDSDRDIAILDRAGDPLDWSAQSQLMDRLERETGQPVDLRMLREGTVSYQAHVLATGRRIWTGDECAARVYAEEVRSAAEGRRSTDTAEWVATLSKLAGRAGQ